MIIPETFKIHSFDFSIILIYVNREERGRSAAHGGRAKRGAPGFALGIVVTGARELCEAVETVGAGCRDFVMCRGQRGEVCVPGVRFAGARLAEGNNPGVWIEGRVLLAGALGCVCVVSALHPVRSWVLAVVPVPGG